MNTHSGLLYDDEVRGVDKGGIKGYIPPKF